MPTKLKDDEEKGFRSWYQAIAQQNGLPLDPDEALDDKGGSASVDHRKFFRRIMDDPDFAEGVENLISHSQYNLDTGKFYKHKDGGISTIYTTSGSDDKGVEHIVPTVWNAQILEGPSIFSTAKASGKKWPTASSPEEADEIADWVHKLVMKQKPRTPVGQRALKLGL